MTIHWWNTDKTVEQLANGQVSEQEAMRYAMISAVLYILMTWFTTRFGYWLPLFEFFVVAIISVLGVGVCFKANGGVQGVDFLKRLSVISVPVGIKVLIGGCLGLLFVDFQVRAIFFEGFLLSFAPAFVFIYYWRIATHLSRLRRSAPSNPTAQGSLPAMELPSGPNPVRPYGATITLVSIRAYLIRLLKLTAITVFSFYFFFGVVLGRSEIFEQTKENLFGSNRAERTADSSKVEISAGQADSISRGVANLKTAIAEYYRINDRLPRANDLLVPPMQGASIHLLENGSVEVLVEGAQQPKVYWRFALRADGYQGWECVSPNITNLEQYLPDCHFDPSYDMSTPVTQEVQINERVSFYFGRSRHDGLVQNDRQRLQEIINDITPTPTRKVMEIQLSGYADPIGSVPHNARLAESRAAFIREALVVAGIDRSLFTLRVMGVDPKASNECQKSLLRSVRIKCFSVSRRVDISVKILKTL